MIYDVSRFGYYRTNDDSIVPGWQSHIIVAETPEEAKAKALPLMDAHPSFTAKDPAEVRIAKCHRHPRYQAKRPPASSSQCGTCHYMWMAVLEATTREVIADGH